MERIVKNVFNMIQMYNYLVYDEHLEFDNFSIKKIPFEKYLVEVFNIEYTSTVEDINVSIKKINLFANKKIKLEEKLVSYFEDFSPEDIYASYIITNYNWIKKYKNVDFIFDLSRLFNQIIENIINLKSEKNYTKKIINITYYWPFIIAKAIKNNLKNDDLYYSSIGYFLFSKIPQNKILSNNTEYRKYINLVGEKIYRIYLIDILRIIKNDAFDKSYKFNKFVFAIKYTNIFNSIELEDYALRFAKMNVFDESIYLKLKELNSKYADEYISQMVMNEVRL